MMVRAAPGAVCDAAADHAQARRAGRHRSHDVAAHVARYASRSARATASASGSAPMSRSNGPTTSHSARSRAAARRSVGATRASLKIVAAVVARRDPVSEEDADAARLVEARERGRVVDRRVVARERPDAPAQAGDRPALALGEHGEGLVCEQARERLVRRDAGDAPAHEAPDRPRLVQAHVARGGPQRVGVGRGVAPVPGADVRIGQPRVEVIADHDSDLDATSLVSCAAT